MATITLTIPDDVNTLLVTAICVNFGYAAIVPNPQNNGAPMANPLTPGQFAQQKLKEWGASQIAQYQAAQVQAAAASAAATAQAAIVPVNPSVVQVAVT